MNRFLTVLVLIIASSLSAMAQPRKLAIFTPLYLDSAFDASGSPRFDKSFPKFITPGLDFYYGAQMALDSLQKRGADLEVFLYDTRGKESLSAQLSKPEISAMELMIAQSNAAETKLLAEAAQRKKIPFVSATFPNDAAVSNNPYFVILNSTLQTHIEGIYRFLQKNNSSDRIIVFRRPGTQEELIKKYLTDFAKTTSSAPLPIRYVDLGADFTLKTIAENLDSTKKNICIAGSLDESFAMKLTQSLSALNKTYPVSVMGMPTWDNFNFNKSGDLEIFYGTPFYYNHTSALENAIAADFSSRMSSRASDMFFRGYETVLRFGLLLLDTKKDLASNLTRKGNTVITQFDIQPVFKDKSTMTLDYFENKHLYFIRVFGGVKNVVN